MRKPIIYLDMDGTIADTYRIENWLERINNLDHTLFSEAAPADRNAVFELLREFDGDVRILTMLPEHNLTGDAKDEYDEKVKTAKLDWLAEHFPEFTEVVFVDYQDSKADLYREGDILIDDSIRQLSAWPGKTVTPEWCLSLSDALAIMGREEPQIKV